MYRLACTNAFLKRLLPPSPPSSSCSCLIQSGLFLSHPKGSSHIAYAAVRWLSMVLACVQTLCDGVHQYKAKNLQWWPWVGSRITSLLCTGVCSLRAPAELTGLGEGLSEEESGGLSSRVINTAALQFPHLCHTATTWQEIFCDRLFKLNI